MHWISKILNWNRRNTIIITLIPESGQACNLSMEKHIVQPCWTEIKRSEHWAAWGCWICRLWTCLFAKSRNMLQDFKCEHHDSLLLQSRAAWAYHIKLNTCRLSHMYSHAKAKLIIRTYKAYTVNLTHKIIPSKSIANGSRRESHGQFTWFLVLSVWLLSEAPWSLQCATSPCHRFPPPQSLYPL